MDYQNAQRKFTDTLFCFTLLSMIDPSLTIPPNYVMERHITNEQGKKFSDIKLLIGPTTWSTIRRTARIIIGKKFSKQLKNDTNWRDLSKEEKEHAVLEVILRFLDLTYS
jgi:hypothetical protein